MPKMGVHGSRTQWLEVALGDDPALAERGDHRGSPVVVVAWSVRCRNTSSRVGRRSSTSSTSVPVRSRARTDGEQCRRPSGRTCLDGDLAGVLVRAPAEVSARASQVGALPGGDDHPVAAEPALQLRGRALGDHPARSHHGDPVGELVGLVEVLRGEQHGGAELDHPAYGLPDLQPPARVEPGRRLVQEQQARAADQAGGDVEPSPHAPGVRRDLAATGSVQPVRRRSARPRAPGPAPWSSRAGGRACTRFSSPNSTSSSAVD